MAIEANMRTEPSGNLLHEKKFNLRMVDGKAGLKLVHLKWSAISWAFLFVLLFAIFFIYKSVAIDVFWQKLLVMVFGFGLAAVFVFGLFTQAYDGVVINRERLNYRYGLVRRSIPLERIQDVQSRKDVLHYKDDGEERVSVTVELWLVTSSKSYHIFDLHGNEGDADQMVQLGEQIRAAMLQRIH